MIEVVRVGLVATVQDAGRQGWAHLGVPRSGALDAPALRRANQHVGNSPGAAGIEVVLRGIRLRFGAAAVVAVTGAPVPVAVDGAAAPFAAPIQMAAGQVLTLGAAPAGLRTYVAVAGGIAVPEVLGSRSTDTLSGLGPQRLASGAVLPIGSDTGPVVHAPEPLAPTAEARVAIWFGPRDDWFTEQARGTLLDSPYQLTPLSDRVGARLAGPALTRVRTGELPSEPLVAGAIQVVPDGQPVVFLADHPTTGGYPVIGVVDDAGLARIAQLRPGGTVRFHGPQR